MWNQNQITHLYRKRLYVLWQGNINAFTTFLVFLNEWQHSTAWNSPSFLVALDGSSIVLHVEAGLKGVVASEFALNGGGAARPLQHTNIQISSLQAAMILINGCAAAAQNKHSSQGGSPNYNHIGYVGGLIRYHLKCRSLRLKLFFLLSLGFALSMHPWFISFSFITS